MTTAEASSSHSVELPADPSPPRPCLTTDQVVAQWHTSPGFRGFWGWINRRCDRVKGKQVMRGPYDGSSEPIRNLVDMLERLSDWVNEVPPQPQSNQRFGNLAFRTYIKLVEERLPAIISSFPNFPSTLEAQLIPLLINSNSFGHSTRLDYGTGHEMAFVLGLWCCVVSGWIGGAEKEDEEDELILRVFARYLELTTLLQKTYKLEPAGSHGVWGLDDYCFLPYLFGSAQLLDSDISPSQALTLAQTRPEGELIDLYTISLHHLTLFKSGASFSEHSPLLHSLSQFPTWTKPFNGLKKMFLGEVVGKRVVVQGLWIGGWTWGENVPASSTHSVALEVREVSEGKDGVRQSAVTKAPWMR